MMKRTNEPAVNVSASAMRAPNQSTRQVPTATIISTIGDSFRTPIIHLSKAEIVKKGIELNAPLQLTWSCYRSEDLACGTCDSCALRLRGFEQAGQTDPIGYAIAS
jgi:7-cyano-7-deazaguanine synthase in queuosine biosynthesis